MHRTDKKHNYAYEEHKHSHSLSQPIHWCTPFTDGLVMFLKAGLKSTKKWLDFYMGDNIRIEAIFKTKIAKIPQKLPKFDILKKRL